MSGWMRRWGTAKPPQVPAGALLRAVARGDSLEQLLERGARMLLATCAADRAGLWLTGGRPGGFGRGRVVEAAPGPIPEHWKHLDVSTPLLQAVLESLEPMRAELGQDDTIARLGPLVGMRGAIWIPLRLRNCTLGLAMVAHEHTRTVVHPELELLRARADEIALAVAHYRDTRRSELAALGLRSQVRLSRAILCGVSVDSILPQIARSARLHVQAEFVALGKADGSPMRPEGWDGPDEWRTLLLQEPLLQTRRIVLEQGREVEIGGDTLPVQSISAQDQALPPLDRVIAIPIEIQNRTYGVLIAGLRSLEDSNNEMVALESYALLAATVLDREAARKERGEWIDSLQRIVEESSECLVIVDEKGRVCEAGRAARAFLHFESGLAKGVLLEDLFSPAAHNAVGEWRERFITHNPEVAPGDKCLVVPLEAALAAGQVVRLHLRSAIDAREDEMRRWLIYFEAHDSRKALHEVEGHLEAEMQCLMDSIDSGVLLLDAAGNIRVVSNRLGQIMGLEARDLFELGTIDALIDSLAGRFSHSAETAARWREHVRQGDEASWDELEILRPSRKVVERFARPLFQANGARLGWIEVYRDITGQRVIQSKLLQTEKMAAVGQLVSGIAHELNNPLTSIQGYAQLLLSRRSALERAADAQRISQEAARAGRIVKNLLLFSRETKPERRAVNLNEVIERTIDLRAYELKVENILVDLSLDGGLPHTLADAAQLQQVVLNLVVNAQQAIQQGRDPMGNQARIRIRTRRLTGDRIGMEFSDNGPGISPDIVSRVFDPFFTTKPVGVGTGLGLSIVYGIVQEHGGEVSVESQPGHGATFTVELPALAATLDFSEEEAATDLQAIAVIPAPSPVRAVLCPQRILVVEDEPSVAQLIADVESEDGHRVDTLLDSREALDRLKEKNYDLIICDLKMPHLDGPHLYRALVRSGSPLQHRVLFVTGDTMSLRTLEFLNSSGLPYLAKPFLVEELKESVRRALATVPADEEVAAGAGLSRVIARRK